MTRLCFFFLFSEEMGKEYKYLKNMFHIYQVRFRAPWWIMREKQGSFLADDVEMNRECLPRK